jgi:hypothetical protein
MFNSPTYIFRQTQKKAKKVWCGSELLSFSLLASPLMTVFILITTYGLNVKVSNYQRSNNMKGTGRQSSSFICIIIGA